MRLRPACLFLAASLSILPGLSVAKALEKSIVVYPWTFTKGTDTARETAISTIEGIGKKNGYSLIAQDVAGNAYGNRSATTSQLVKFGKKVHANYVVYGSISWHTRSIWVGTGPKTISTATVNAKVLNVDTGKITFKKSGVTGRSDEKENALKVAGAVLLTPLVTAVSGGPMTPQEQRAVQIALARTFENWNKTIGK